MIQKAFLEKLGYQCGFCTPGMVLNAHAFLQAHPHADQGIVRDWMEGNLCRCTGYEGIRRAIAAASGSIRDE